MEEKRGKGSKRMVGGGCSSYRNCCRQRLHPILTGSGGFNSCPPRVIQSAPEDEGRWAIGDNDENSIRLALTRMSLSPLPWEILLTTRELRRCNYTAGGLDSRRGLWLQAIVIRGKEITVVFWAREKVVW
ncbi:hypothetical protein CDAR_280231 [Caerostris darwini]|uniref:Uncharacterized protein n=1 Tax=Caerostris darwini TaxID=1538125 RepID=A0AAV4SAR2_9ARAC|nr:hypothetical protein CDAR_280231 [Caerostris darwini]